MKKRIMIFLGIFSAFALALLYSCGKPTAGTGSETGNARGKLVRSNNSPAAGVKVRFISVDYNPSSSAKILASVDSTTTNADGKFGIDLDSGTYNMFGDGDTILSFKDSVRVGDDTVTINDTLKVPGKITGVSFMPFQDSANQARVTIYAPGTSFYAKPDIGGAFSFDNVPEGTYRLIFDPTLDEYYLKVITVTVTAGQTTNLDTVILYGTGITGMPVANAGNDTTVSINDTIWLHGTAIDNYGTIVKYEWDFDGFANSYDYVETSSGDTSIIATTLDVWAYFRVTDDDKNQSVDSVYLRQKPLQSCEIQLRIIPLSGYENIVDAVTRASNVADDVKIRVDEIAYPSDSVKDVVIDFGDGSSNYEKRNRTFQVNQGFITISHWYVKVGMTGICTTKAIATTYKGAVADTGIIVRVLGASEH